MRDANRPRTGRGNSATFYYDADCRMCAAVVRWLRRLDWRNRVLWIPIHTVESPPPGITREDFERSAYLVCAREITMRGSSPSVGSQWHCHYSSHSAR